MISKKSWFKRFFVSLLAISVFVVACDNDDDTPEEKITFNVTGTLSGSQEVPAVTTSASGSVTGTYNKNTNTLVYSVTWTGLSGPATASHIHGPAAIGVNAGVMVGLTITATGATGAAAGTLILTDPQETELLAGRTYVNVHTAANPGGEIRAQLTAQ